jgi:hypothetical protein
VAIDWGATNSTKLEAHFLIDRQGAFGINPNNTASPFRYPICL